MEATLHTGTSLAMIQREILSRKSKVFYFLCFNVFSGVTTLNLTLLFFHVCFALGGSFIDKRRTFIRVLYCVLLQEEALLVKGVY